MPENELEAVRVVAVFPDKPILTCHLQTLNHLPDPPALQLVGWDTQFHQQSS